MAKSIHRPALQSFKISQAVFLLLALLLIASPCYVHSLDFPVTSEASSAQKGRTLLENNPTNKQSTMKVHEEQVHNNPTASSTTSTPATAATKAANTDRQFGTAAHEVPSGPNPESNR